MDIVSDSRSYSSIVLHVSLAFGAADALVYAEVRGLHYFIPDFPKADEGEDEHGRPKPRRPIISSPNCEWLPDLSCDEQLIRARKDGRFYTGDFTLWPQWYFPATPYLPYVRARPAPEQLESHEYKLAWYDL